MVKSVECIYLGNAHAFSDNIWMHSRSHFTYITVNHSRHSWLYFQLHSYKKSAQGLTVHKFVRAVLQCNAFTRLRFRQQSRVNEKECTQGQSFYGNKTCFLALWELVSVAFWVCKVGEKKLFKTNTNCQSGMPTPCAYVTAAGWKCVSTYPHICRELWTRKNTLKIH